MKTNLSRTAKLLTTVLVLGSLTACSGTGLPKNGDFKRIGDQTLQERSADGRRTANEAVNFFAEQPVTRLETGGSSAFSLTTDPGQTVPDVPIGAINAAPMEFGALLNQVAEQAGMSWRIAGPGKDSLLGQQIYFVQRNESLLKTVLDELSELTEAFYRVEGDRIIFSQDRLFVARVPRMAESQDVLVSGLGTLGAEEIFADELSGTVTFRATRPVYKGAKRLMHSLEQGRDMVVYDFWIIDRNISDNAAAGVDVSIEGLSSIASNITEGNMASGGISIVESIVGGGADGGFISGNLGGIGIEATTQFLRALGETETVARPTISMLSGGSSNFFSGEKAEYIRSINTSSTSDGESTSSGTDVRSLDTGVTIDVKGSHSNGVISTAFTLDISELLAFEEYDTGSVSLKLPKTASRKLESHLEARPGDVMVLGGIIREREAKNATEIPGVPIPPQRGRASSKTETIILVRPRLVQIRPAPGKSSGGALVIEPGVGQVAPEENPISEVIAEEGQARSLLRRMKD
jgi:type II secretory pathway component GspD/PulD (secretin)